MGTVVRGGPGAGGRYGRGHLVAHCFVPMAQPGTLERILRLACPRVQGESRARGYKGLAGLVGYNRTRRGGGRPTRLALFCCSKWVRHFGALQGLAVWQCARLRRGPAFVGAFVPIHYTRARQGPTRPVGIRRRRNYTLLRFWQAEGAEGATRGGREGLRVAYLYIILRKFDK